MQKDPGFDESWAEAEARKSHASARSVIPTSDKRKLRQVLDDLVTCHRVIGDLEKLKMAVHAEVYLRLKSLTNEFADLEGQLSNLGYVVQIIHEGKAVRWDFSKGIVTFVDVIDSVSL